MTVKHLYTDGTDTYVATSPDHAWEMFEAHVGEARKKAEQWTDLDQIPDDKLYRIYIGEDECVHDVDEFMSNSEQKTAVEWARQNEPGFLCSTEC